MKEIILALEQTVNHLETSREDAFSELTPKEIIKILNIELLKIKNGQNFLTEDIYFMYLPTTSLQDIAVISGWGDEYMKFAEVIDKFKR